MISIICFQDLQPQVKLKLLLSFLHIGRRNLETWKTELEDILDVALQDSEPWVSMLADLLSSFPSSGQLNHDARGEGRKIYLDLMTDLKKTLKKHGDQSDLVLPLECHFLNKNAFISVVGHQPQPTKHFSLKRKPKAAALKADLIQRSQEAANKAKSQMNSFPSRQRTMPKKMSDTGPLRGLPSRPLANAGFRNPRVSLPNRQMKKEGGVKMLEITEQPIGYAAAKKRKRQQEMEEAKRVAEEAAVTNASAKTESSGSAVPSTPDYAANLSSNIGPAGVPPPAYAPPTPAAPAPAPAYAPAPAVTVPLATPQASLPGTTVTVPLPTQPLPQTAAVTRLVQLPTQPLPASQLSHSNMVTPSSAAGQPGVARQVTVQQTGQQPQAAALQPQQLVQLQQQAVVQQRQQTQAQPSQPQQFQQPQILRQVSREWSGRASHECLYFLQPSVQTIQTPVPPQRRNLSLTKEQMLEAQEMFRTANKVTRPEKALILGFMAGSR